MDKTVHKVIKNFLPERQLKEITKANTFLTSSWFDFPAPYEYQRSILEEASSFVDLSSAIGVEEWFHNPYFQKLPTEHYDKDEKLFAATGEIVHPLCSCILYIKVDNLVGADLHLIEEGISITPTSNTLILMKPGVYHKVTDYISGIRSSLYLNPWDRELFSGC
jgi:hypothetical protein